MMYHKYYNEDVEWIKRVTREGVEALGSKAPLYSGLHISMLTPEELARATRLAYEGGASGVCLFTATAMSNEHWTTLRSTLESLS